MSQYGNLPQIEVKIKNLWNHNLEFGFLLQKHVTVFPCLQSKRHELQAEDFHDAYQAYQAAKTQ